MAASVEYRMVMKENEDDLSMFLEMHNRETGRNSLALLENSNEFDDSLGSKPDNFLESKIKSTMHSRKGRDADFLDSENDKSDYDWLLTPPPIKESQNSLMKLTGKSKPQTTASRSKLADAPVEPARRSSSAGIRRRPSSSASAASRPTTPTVRPILPATSKPLRSSTPTSRTTVLFDKATAPPKRSSTPTSSTAHRSSTPTARPFMVAASKSTSRSATQTNRSSTPSGRSSSVTKSGPTTIKSRPGSASKERPSAPSTRPSSTENTSNGRTRGRVSNGNSQNSGRPVIVRSTRKYSNTENDDVNPVLMGTQMVERVVNMRKLAPPKRDDPNLSGKSSSSQENSGFGRSLSKSSLDMAMRHMDIRRSVNSGNIRSLMKDVPASFLYSTRNESAKFRNVGASDSPRTTSSDASSECSSVNNNFHGEEVQDIDVGSEGN